MTASTLDSTQAVDRDRLVAALARHVDGEIRFDAGTRAAYSTDASNYRHVPLGVVVPRTVGAGARALRVCAEHGVAVASRGGGTSLSGQATTDGVVVDWSKYCNRLVSVDPDRRTCVVEPGIVLDQLNAALAPHALEFGPRPATHDHCTLGGMIGNNSCGATAQRTGKVVDNVERLDVQLYDGTRMWVGRTTDGELEEILGVGGRRAEVYRGLRSIRDRYLAQLRTGYPQIPRRVSGYNLDSLLPENGFDVARMLVGSESTLVTVLHAELRLLPTVRATATVLLSYADIAAAADDVTAVLETDPLQLEGLDARIVDVERDKAQRGGGGARGGRGGRGGRGATTADEAIDLFTGGEGFLLVGYGGDDGSAAVETARAALRRLGRDPEDDGVLLVADPERQAAVHAVREAALGAAAHSHGAPDAWPGWEDSAVHPDGLGDYLRDLRALMDRYGYTTAAFYGHFGQACVHTRVPFDLVTEPGVAAFRSFMTDAARLVVSYGGSLSGEHGDGQARGELLPIMFGTDLFRAFCELKDLFDPNDRMNPGQMVPARPLDADLRLGADFSHPAPQTRFGYADDEGSFSRAVQRCVGVGACRRDSGGVMCPSYMVTREEEHSTRGRARLLFEMLDGTARGGSIEDGWRSTEVRDALDLCFACKGCKSDCPVNVDMATYKAEFLSHHYARRLRPPAHYSMGWLPVAAAGAAAAPGAVNALLRTRGVSDVLLRAAGIDAHRRAPAFARHSLQSWYAARGPRGDGRRGEVLLWPDTFTNRFEPGVGRAAVEVLEDAGWRVVVPRGPLCCGLTWISTGQLGIAARVLGRTVDRLRPHLRAGTPVVGLEPSCTAVFRSDATELLPGEDVERLRDQTVTLAELLRDADDWAPPRIEAATLRQTHCHHHAIMGTGADDDLLDAVGVTRLPMDSGCCGLAGDFGFTAGHYDVSVAAAERVLLPAVREADEEVVVLADGFSCRTQIAQGDSGGRSAVHLAELLRAGLRGFGPRLGDRPETRITDRRSPG